MASKRRRPQGRWDEKFKRRIVAEAAASKLSASEVARQHGLNPNLVFSWRKKYGVEASPVATGKEVCLLPVEIQAEEALPRAPDSRPTGDSQTTASDFLDIELPCGSKLRCSGGISPALLGQALSALKPKTPETSGSTGS